MKKVTRILLVFLGMSSILYAQDSSISSVDEGLNELTAFYIHKGTFDNAQELKKTAVHYFMSNGLVKINEESVVPPSINYENRDLSLQDFLYKHIEYPEASQRLADADQGTEIVEFIVTGEGLIKIFISLIVYQMLLMKRLNVF